MLKTALRLLVAVTVSGACLYYALRGTDWANVGRLVGAADWGWIFGVVVASLASHVLRAERWRILLRPVVRAPYGPALSATLVGFGASMVLPLRAGEIVRPWLFARRVGIGLTPSVASVIIERLLDMLLVLTCFLVVTLSYPALAEYRLAAIALGSAGVGVLGVLYVSTRARPRADALLERVTARLPLRGQRIVRPVVSGVLDGARGIGDPATLLLVLGMSAGLWALITSTYLLSFLAMHLHVPLVAASLATVVIVAAFVFLPQMPGFVGTWQTACLVSLTRFGVPHDQVVAYSLLTWVIQIVVNVGAGAVAFAFQDLSMSQLAAAQKDGVASKQAAGS
jgi:uncharacterized protein (TIRG00374 family)